MFVWKRACQVDWCVGRRTLCLKEKGIYCLVFVRIRVHYVWIKAKGVHYVLFISKRSALCTVYKQKSTACMVEAEPVDCG